MKATRFIGRRSLYRERGLKFKIKRFYTVDLRSLPLPGAWIEIDDLWVLLDNKNRRSLYRERGLKLHIRGNSHHHNRRSLYRERGLKYRVPKIRIRLIGSLPSPGVQIEINRMTNGTQNFTLPMKRVIGAFCVPLRRRSGAFCHTLSAQFGT